tara:strand:+ start:537 stop:1133 length:597 start_codon:yes stop_codon:yes gene_type:complete
MPIVINGNGTISGVSVGGLPDGIVDTDMIAAGAVTSAKSTGLGGLSMVDQWRCNSDSGENNGVLAHNNWERVDTMYDKIGTGMTESSGVFTFPSTGIYRIDFQGHSKRTDNITVASINATIQGSTNSGSNYSDLAQSTFHIGGANNSHGQAYCTAIFDVTDTSTHRLRVNISGDQPTNFRGDSGNTRTGLTFMKLGET